MSDTYRGPSRLADSTGLDAELATVPDDVDGISAFVRERTIHHNVAAARGLAAEQFARVWPPVLADVLAADRLVIGACFLESHLLAGLLRYRGFDVRARAGYFRDIRRNAEHVVEFWRRVAAAKGREPDDAYTRAQNDVDHRIEHWACELHEDGAWTVIDANTDFLREHSALEVPVRLPRLHFEHADEAWRELAAGAPPERYAEEPGRGREHVRRQLLLDFFSLLNHDLADVDGLELGDDVYDRLADVLARDPGVDALVDFYRATPELRLPSAEADPYAFV